MPAFSPQRAFIGGIYEKTPPKGLLAYMLCLLKNPNAEFSPCLIFPR